ncbi:hypothetical protein TNCV_4355461 [Trichonephila clavipes]|nr:hypothetical protein TNCV_4355461 [Trichonephila clavipes]
MDSIAVKDCPGTFKCLLSMISPNTSAPNKMSIGPGWKQLTSATFKCKMYSKQTHRLEIEEGHSYYPSSHDLHICHKFKTSGHGLLSDWHITPLQLIPFVKYAIDLKQHGMSSVLQAQIDSRPNRLLLLTDRGRHYLYCDRLTSAAALADRTPDMDADRQDLKVHCAPTVEFLSAMGRDRTPQKRLAAHVDRRLSTTEFDQ